MFLTKKNAALTTKAKNTTKKRPLGGWEDDEDQSPPYKQISSKHVQPQPHVNLLQGTNQSEVAKEIQKQTKYSVQVNNKPDFICQDWDTLNERNDIDCQKILIENIVNSGGIRIKPTDSMLTQFAKEVRGMQVHVIGSLLLSKLEVNYPFQVKAKSLYIIEHLAKKHKEYENYFRSHSNKIKEFPQPEDSVENYRKIQRTVLNQLGKQIEKVEVEHEKPKYIDPGYHQDVPKSQIGSFLEMANSKEKKNEGKKTIIGPGQVKNKTGMKGPKEEIHGDNLLDLNPASKAEQNDLMS